MNKNTLQTHKGFTLVEMAIVLVIVGLLVGLGSSMIGPLTSMAKLRETRDTIDADMSSVVSWGASNNRIPNTYTEFQTVISKQSDAYGNPLYYFFDSSLVAANICGRRPTNSLNASSLTICRTSACIAAERVTDVAYAIISGGDNRNPQTGIIACPAGVSGTCIGVYDSAPSTDNCTTAVDCPAANVPAVFLRTAQVQEYDDTVRWITLDELRSKIGCQGAQLKILNNELPPASAASAYSATLLSDGGVPFTTGPNTYRWCVQSAAPPGLTFAPTILNANCAGLAEASWSPATSSLTLSGTATTSGTYNFTVFVRDNNGPTTSNDNVASKSFVLTVNP
ncbi:MAG: prepilin-type N-terminal cleavage/methylation domain-containing protein [Desulfuromonadaceae bacterium]|nr:prepilin-type N-terminal cleavage/methylation domain-containing protein [Desulfuromonadaceae bacterium]MDD2848797.1 prepilin-type N-terminal cleavage/methylation domain-containing protein [Desulfuromonadaceae bacterium]MDD4130447.1 prepilin-type N-terminal cleavage/methylation domain-containing protein [Desulfuromonadaceae bacterium]